MGEKFRRFMSGRYGGDNLSRFMLAVALVLIVANFFLGLRIISTMTFVVLIINMVRIMSRNINARYRENIKYISIRNKVLNFFRGIFGKGVPKDKQNRIFKCPGCGQKVRVPRGRGKIAITCPKCGVTFLKRT